MTNKYTSEELFHFVGHVSPGDNDRNYEVLKKVLKSRCISHPPHDGSWGETSHKIQWNHSLESEKLIIPTVTCYADIPYKSLSVVHMSKYGKFGIALPRQLLTRVGARPVTYIPMHSDDWGAPGGRSLLRDIEANIKGFKKQILDKQKMETSKSRFVGEEPTSIEDVISNIETTLLKDFLAFIKPFDSELTNKHPNNFYMEREWRKHGNMKFETTQVTKVVVAKGYKTQINEDFPEYKDRIFEV